MRNATNGSSKEPRLQSTIDKIVTYKPTLKQIFISVCLVFALLQTNVVLALSGAASQDQIQDISETVVIREVFMQIPQEPIVGPLYDYHFKLGPSVEYWNEVAQCETASNWQDDGQWAGGLGIYTTKHFEHPQSGTWERWGGEQFAPTPQQASKFHQIIVANRVAVLGWDTIVYRDPAVAKRRGVPAQYHYIKDPTGFGGWGCIKSKQTGKWRIGKPKQNLNFTVALPQDPQYYCPTIEPLLAKYGLPVRLFSHIAWRDTRCNPNYIHPTTKKIGLFQIDPTAFASALAELGLVPTDLKNSELNVLVASWIVTNHPNRIGNWGYNFIYNK